MKNRKTILLLVTLGVIAAIFFGSMIAGKNHKKTTYKFTDWSAIVPTNLNTYDCGIMWVKMVQFWDSTGKKWEVNSDGDSIGKTTVFDDTFYLLRTGDLRLPVRDSAGKPLIDGSSHQPMYYMSWYNASPAPKDVITPLHPIPSRFIPLMNASIPSPSDTIKHPAAPSLAAPLKPDTSKTPLTPTRRQIVKPRVS